MEQNVKVMQEKAVLVGLNCDLFTKEEAANERTLDELEALLETAGGVCVGKILQNRHEPDPHSFIGEGKAEEVREWVQNTGATLVIFDNDLTPSQVRALEEATKAHGLPADGHGRDQRAHPERHDRRLRALHAKHGPRRDDRRG